MALRVFAPAKVNLHLAVGEKGDDGYHAVRTVLQALSFGDTVTISAAGEFSFACTPDLGLMQEDNLACRAALAMAERFGHPLDVEISVEKRVPHGAGLGGASADAAATIVGLAQLWDVAACEDALTEVARSLGADVPFFLTGGAALLGGRGDALEEVLRPLDAPVVIVKPAEPVPTGQAYAAFDRLGATEPPAPDELTEALAAGDTTRVARHLYNNMTPASVGLVPGIGGAIRLLAESPGVLGALMAGSGSAVFGVCESAEAAQRAARAGQDAGLWAVATHAHAAGCRVDSL